MKQIMQSQQSQINSTDEVNTVIISRCMNCKDGVVYPPEFEIPIKDDNYPKCNNCGHKDLQFYKGKNRKDVMKGGNYRMADDKKKPVAKKAAKPKASGDKKSPRGYGDDIRNKVIEMGKQSKTVKEIEKCLGPKGPKAKAIIRYLKAAGIKDIKRK